MPASPAPPPPRRVRRKEARPGELLDAALTLFVERGYAATRVEEVASLAGVSKGTLFLYFPSKEDLFKAVVRETITGHFAKWNEELESFGGDTASLVRKLMHSWWERVGQTRAAGITKLVISEACMFPDIANFYQNEVITPGHRLIRSILQRGVDRGEFRPLDIDHAVYCLIAPMIFLIMWKHSLASSCPSSQVIDPLQFIDTQATLLLEGMLQRPAA
ncbi:MAG: TetR/AcrR family transcriptional regulator [Burkholderiaceae bacterium]